MARSALPRAGGAARVVVRATGALVISLILLSASLLASGAVGSDPGERGSRGSSSPDSARIARIEHGLLRTVAVRGRSDSAFALSDRMSRYAVPGVSIAVIDGGRLAWARAFGLLAADGTQRVDTASLFQAGSISKAVTAVAALRLVERGELRLDEDVNRRLVAWKIPPSELTRTTPVTLRGLLSHGAGLNVPSYRGYLPGEPVPTLAQVLEGAPPANTPAARVEVAPGTRWSYSGSGMSVVQLLLTDATHRPFADILREMVLEPAAMTFTLAEQPLSTAHAVSAATGHSAGAPVAGRWRVFPEIAAAGLWSTAPDLARFGIAVLRSIRGEPGALLGPALARDMVTRQIGNWGLGFALGTAGGDSATVGHDGSTLGFTARLYLLPATGQGIAVMTNGESEALIDEVMRAVAHEYSWPARLRVEKTVAAVDPAGFASLAGRYRVEASGRTFDFTVSVEGSGEKRRLLIAGPSGRTGELLPLSAMRFFSQDTGNEFTFVRDGKDVTRMEIDQQGERFSARRLP